MKATLGDEAGASHAIGYYRSVLRSLLVPSPSALETYRIAFSRIAVPALVFSGDRDGCIASDVYSGIENAFASPVRFSTNRSS